MVNDENQTNTAQPNNNTVAPLPTVTIIMPSHNRRDRLERALRAIAAQTYPMELLDMVLVLDGCADNSEELTKQLRPELPFRLLVISQPQGGPASARNTAVRNAHGDILLFLDDDVQATPTLIEEHIRLQLEDEKAVVLGPLASPPEPDYPRPVWVRWEEYQLEKQHNELVKGVYEPTARQFYTGNGSMRRKWMVGVGGFDEELKRAEDIELAYRMDAKFNLRFYFNPNAIGYHYAYRSFDSWKRAHYLYGKYDVLMDRDKGHDWIVQTVLEEFQERNKITRLSSQVLLNHTRLQWLIGYLLVGIAQVARKVGKSDIGNKSLSILANTLYWQGFNDELKNSKFSAEKSEKPREVRL
jgi:GT2 family glycosyltransferase